MTNGTTTVRTIDPQPFGQTGTQTEGSVMCLYSLHLGGAAPRHTTSIIINAADAVQFRQRTRKCGSPFWCATYLERCQTLHQNGTVP
jgi:hypothetical protein